ncbi:hypothetical protein TNCV_1619741 [Trichonephila clavipes]|nr:hypothetical protein TNCV_1619741 [Trichonephila clavipes]
MAKGYQSTPYGRSGPKEAEISLGYQSAPYGRSVGQRKSRDIPRLPITLYGRSVAKGKAEISLGYQSAPYGRSVGQRERRDYP